MLKKKKQWLTVLALCVILLALCGIYFFANRYQNQKEKAEKEDADKIVLYSLKKEDLAKIHYKNSKADITFVKEDGKWKLESDKDFPADQSKIETMVESAAEITAQRKVVENCRDLSEYELENPMLQIEVTTQDGQTGKIACGMESIAAEGRYAYSGDSRTIYVVPSSMTDEFDYSRNELMELPELPEINAEYVTAYSTEKKQKTTFHAVYDAKRAKYKGIYGWDIKEPYSQTVAGDQDGLQNAFAGIAALEFTQGVSYRATKEELKKYGLLSPNNTVHVKYYTVTSETGEKDTESPSADAENAEEKIKEEDKVYHNLELLIGSKDDTGENYYVTMAGNPGIYLLSAETVKSIAEIDAFSCVYAMPCPVNTDTIQKISLQYRGKNDKITASKEENFQKAYQAFGEIEYASVIKKEAVKGSNTPVAVVTFTEKDKTSTVTFLPYDGVNFYRVDVDGVCQFVAEKNVIDKALEGLIALQ